MSVDEIIETMLHIDNPLERFSTSELATFGEAINYLREYKKIKYIVEHRNEPRFQENGNDAWALIESIIEEWPPVVEKDNEQESILNKIRAEIANYQKEAFYSDDVVMTKRMVLAIIDKYKAESEAT